MHRPGALDRAQGDPVIPLSTDGPIEREVLTAQALDQRSGGRLFPERGRDAGDFAPAHADTQQRVFIERPIAASEVGIPHRLVQQTLRDPPVRGMEFLLACDHRLGSQDAPKLEVTARSVDLLDQPFLSGDHLLESVKLAGRPYAGLETPGPG
jgi:hypothetical protein